MTDRRRVERAEARPAEWFDKELDKEDVQDGGDGSGSNTNKQEERGDAGQTCEPDIWHGDGFENADKMDAAREGQKDTAIRIDARIMTQLSARPVDLPTLPMGTVN